MRIDLNSNEKLPGKVLAIYEAVSALIAEGRDMADLKVSDITRRAGIGKGTAYGYFSSKEEMVGRAIIYYFCMKNNHLLQEIRRQQDLRQILLTLIDSNLDSGSGLYIYQYLRRQAGSEDPDTMKAQLEMAMDARRRMMTSVEDVLLKHLDREVEDEKYARFVLASVVNMIGSSCVYAAEEGFNKEDFADKCLRMIRASL